MRHHFGIGTPKQAAASILRGLIALLFGLHGGAIRLFRAFRPRAGYGSDEDRAHAREAGFDEYMVKPVDLYLLRDHLQRGRVTLQNR